MSRFVLASSDYGPLIINGTDTGVGWQISMNRCHEPELVDMVKILATRCFELYGRGVTILDVGANIGTCTVPWGHHLRDWGYVTGYEPQERVFYALAGNVALNNLMNVNIRNMAVAHYSGFMSIPQMNHNMVGNFGGLSLKPTDKMPDQPVSYKPENMIRIETITIDDEPHTRVDIIKIDVEGMEPDVMDGACHTIWDQKPIIIAEFIHCGREAIESRLMYYDFFERRGNLICVPHGKPEIMDLVAVLCAKEEFRL